MEGEGDNGQPSLKKIKLDNDLIEESIFKNFKKDEEKLSDLQYAVTALNEGYNRMNFILIKFIEANARSSARFTKATCDTAQYDGEVFVAASIFLKGIDVLEQYILSDRIKVPSDDRQRKALNKLLKFLSEDHDALFEERNYEGKEGDWAVKVVQHLLTKLAVDNKYILAPYTSESGTLLRDEFIGHIGDTSFGCAKGWHGQVDIILEDNLPVQLLKDPQPGDCTDSSVSSIEIKPNEHFLDGDQKQLLAQTVVFSFLQQKYNKVKLKNSLIPAVGISTKQLYIHLYDCENDVFLSSDSDLQMFGGGKLVVEIVVLLWLTLNYRYFCTGITEEMRKCKADFHRRLDDMIYEYIDNVKRPLHLSTKTRKSSNWAAVRGKKVKKIFDKNEYYELENHP